jgi:hypothetical protein
VSDDAVRSGEIVNAAQGDAQTVAVEKLIEQGLAVRSHAFASLTNTHADSVCFE